MTRVRDGGKIWGCEKRAEIEIVCGERVVYLFSLIEMMVTLSEVLGTFDSCMEEENRKFSKEKL